MAHSLLLRLSTYFFLALSGFCCCCCLRRCAKVTVSVRKTEQKDGPRNPERERENFKIKRNCRIVWNRVGRLACFSLLLKG